MVFSNDRASLSTWPHEARRRLELMQLLLHERKSRIYPVAEGIPFLGFGGFCRANGGCFRLGKACAPAVDTTG